MPNKRQKTKYCVNTKLWGEANSLLALAEYLLLFDYVKAWNLA